MLKFVIWEVSNLNPGRVCYSIIINDFFNTYQFIGNRHVTPQNSMMNFYWRIELIIVIVELYHVDCTVQAQLSLSVVS